jgi:hypothetical protein
LESAPLQRVTVAQSDQRQLEGAGSHLRLGGRGARQRRYTRVDKTLRLRPGVASGKMEPASLQWATVAPGDLKTPERRQTPFSRGKLRRTSQESTRRSESVLAFQAARCSLTSSLGHRRTWRPQDTGKAPDAVLTREASENVTGVDKTLGKRSRGAGGKMEPDVIIGSLAHLATRRHRRGARRQAHAGGLWKAAVTVHRSTREVRSALEN